ncbi:MAG: acyl-CoA dehydrogenase, partial [Gammaproteobacteria bacterium]|nr:acyl-CoA dehydrogenase [Gammaproteobacteria bacterium]
MDFSEPIDLKLIREAISNVCRDFPDEYWEKHDREGKYPQDFYDAIAEAGWIGIAIPEAYGGAGKGVQEAA